MEFVRHRVFSFAQESTRYCNYSKDKFNNELTFIIPSWLPNITEGCYQFHDGDFQNRDPWTYRNTNGSQDQDFGYCSMTSEGLFLDSLQKSEDTYFALLGKPNHIYDKSYSESWQPQQARQVLPNALKTELVMTGFISDWKHFFELRTPGSAHPDARALAIPLEEQFKKVNLIK